MQSRLNTGRTAVIAAVSLGLAFLFDYFFFAKAIGIAFPIFTTLLLGALFVFTRIFHLPFRQKVCLTAAAALFFSCLVFFRASEFLTFWNLVLTLGLLLLFSKQLAGFELSRYRYFDYFKNIVFLPFAFLTKALHGISGLLSAGRSEKHKETTERVVRGIIITLPILALFLLLLSSADVIFGRLVSNFLNVDIEANTIAQIIIIIASFLAMLGAYTYTLQNITPHAIPVADDTLPVKKPSFGSLEIGILLGSINSIFLLFLFVQFRYLFAGENAVTTLGYTYAEYARKGFYELTAIALLAFLLVYAVARTSQKFETPSRLFRPLSLLLIGQIFVVLASALTRLGLYEEAYGLTEIRFYSHAFILFLGVLHIFLVYNLVTRFNHRLLAFQTFLSGLAFVAILNLLNPDALIARQNIRQFAGVNKLDTAYFYSLSPDAVSEYIPLLSMEGQKNRDGENLPKAAAELLDIQYSKISRTNDFWQSFHFSRSRAKTIIHAQQGTVTRLLQ